MSGYDIVLLLGQSNANGSNTDFEVDGLDRRDERILTFPGSGPDAGRIVPATEPLAPIGAHPPGGMGPAGPFASLLLPTLPDDRRILIVPVTMGGTGMRSHSGYPGVWLPGFVKEGAPNLFDATLDHLAAAVAAAGRDVRVAVVLWHQGETDGSRTEQEYAADLDHLIGELRARAPITADAPFIVGQLALERLDAYPDHLGVDAAHRGLARRVPNTGFAAAPPRGHVNDVTTHITAAGQRILGANYFAEYVRLTSA